MANPITQNSLSTIYAIFFFLSLLLTAGNSQSFSRHLSKKQLGLKKEKISHLHFYFHDIVSGKNPTAVRVASAAMTNTSPTGFGATVMIDDKLTLKPEFDSKEVGRAQGIYASADLDEAGLLMVMNFAFTEGKYNGSNLSVMGRNAVFTDVRELPVVGGSGVFRYARGSAHAKTVWFNLTTGDAAVEYDVFVFHY